MESHKAIITIVEEPAGDGQHTALQMRVELHPPLMEGEEPPLTYMAAMLAVERITQVAQESGGGLVDMHTSPRHDDEPEWWKGGF